MAPIIGRKVAKGPAKKKALTFTIDCSKPVEDKIMEVRRLAYGPAYQPWMLCAACMAGAHALHTAPTPHPCSRLKLCDVTLRA